MTAGLCVVTLAHKLCDLQNARTLKHSLGCFRFMNINQSDFYYKPNKRLQDVWTVSLPWLVTGPYWHQKVNISVP